MKEMSIYQYYAFGYNYNIWRSGSKGKTVAVVIEELEQYQENVTSLELQVTSHVIKSLDPVILSLKQLKGEDIIPEAKATEIHEIIEGADKTLDAELELKKVLSVTPKRFNTDMLLATPQGLLAHGSWELLSKTARKDFSQAARCIAMNLATAAAFHLMRCVEEMVKILYFDFIKQKRMPNPMWGPMIVK